jgi:hypothetical protein
MADSHLHVSCQEVVELVSDYLEQALPPERASVFEQHLNFCDGCVVYVDQVRETVRTVGDLRPEHVPAETRAKLMAAFRDWKRS